MLKISVYLYMCLCACILDYFEGIRIKVNWEGSRYRRVHFCIIQLKF